MSHLEVYTDDKKAYSGQCYPSGGAHKIPRRWIFILLAGICGDLISDSPEAEKYTWEQLMEWKASQFDELGALCDLNNSLCQCGTLFLEKIKADDGIGISFSEVNNDPNLRKQYYRQLQVCEVVAKEWLRLIALQVKIEVDRHRESIDEVVQELCKRSFAFDQTKRRWVQYLPESDLTAIWTRNDIKPNSLQLTADEFPLPDLSRFKEAIRLVPTEKTDVQGMINKMGSLRDLYF